MKRIACRAIAVLMAAATCAPACAQAPALETPPSAESATDAQKRDAIAAMMSELFKAEPLTTEQEARLPLARQVVTAMTPEGFYAEMMDTMMGSMLEPMFALVGDHAAAEEALERQVGLSPENQPDLSEEERTQLLALLDPAAKERATAVQTSITGLIADISRQIEAPFRDGLSKAFAVRFDDGELRDVQRFFATPSGASFARQSLALYADPQVMSASMSIMPKILESAPQMAAQMEQAVAKLPKQRGYGDLSPAERQQLARLLGMTEKDLRGTMIKAERERAKEQQD